MKPINLKISGLHSFRETQTVDFSFLGAAGLFGIFGPTGSGKSSILDAVTLALFGKVERAARGTQGIINHAAERVAVELVFELTRDEVRRRYRVERVYKRSGDNTVALQAARLVELTDGGEVPLAAMRAVDDEVARLLGLTVDDFTRAVVLPQGKFDEFLKKVRPADRRAMLERIFDLQEYGDRLQKKVDRAYEAVARTLAACASELQGLGDASDEALREAGRTFTESVRLADETVERYRVLERERAEMGQVWAWQEESAGVRSALEELALQGPAMEKTRERLAASVRAARVMPMVTGADEAASAHREAQKILQEVREKLPETVERAAGAQQEWRLACERRNREQPRLQARRSQLERAVRLEEEAAALETDRDALREEWTRLAEEERAAHARGEELAREKAAGEEELAACLAELGQVQVDQEWRRRVLDALAAWEDWQKARRDHDQARADLAAREKAEAAARRALEAAAETETELNGRLLQAGREERSLRENRPEEEGSLEAAAVETERLRSQAVQLRDLESALEEAAAVWDKRRKQAAESAGEARQAAALLARTAEKQAASAARVKELEENLTGLRLANQAYILAQTLREDDPCPVCGSRHHPCPAATGQAVDRAAGELAAAQKQAALLQEELDQARAAEAAVRAASEALARAAAEAAAGPADLRTRIDERRAGLPAGWEALDASARERELVALTAGLVRRREALTVWRREMEAAQAALEAARAAAGQTAVARAGAESGWRSAAEATREASARAASAGEELTRLRVRLDEVRGDLAVEKIREEQKSIDRHDAARLELEKRREALEVRRRSVAAALEKQGARAGELQVAVSVRAERLAHLGGQAEDKRREVAAVTGGRAAGEMLQATDTSLRDLAETETAAGESAREAATAKEKLEKELAVAESAFQSAVGRLAKSVAGMEAALDKEGFVSENEAREMLLPAAEQAQGEQTLAAYQDAWDRETNRARDLAAKLAGRELSAAAWRECQDGVARAAEDRDRALEDKGAKGREYGKIRQNNVRWKELRGRQERAADRGAKLEELKALLRGKAFVDFLAEEQLAGMAAGASQRLGRLTNHRYALEVDSEGSFVIRDDANGGVRRPVSSLSGGETFITSLALALALSLQIQLKGRFPLEFFFLDEGFGTLDPDLLEVVVSTLEKLQLEHLNIGIISHVPELRNRFPRQLVVHPAEPSGRGSRLVAESN